MGRSGSISAGSGEITFALSSLLGLDPGECYICCLGSRMAFF